MIGNIIKNNKERMLLISLDTALKSVNLLKDNDKIIAGYKYALKYANDFLSLSLNYLNKNKENITEKKLKKEMNKFKLNEKIYNNVIKMDQILSTNIEVKEMANQFKMNFKEYKLIFNK